ncbi:MAG: 16S rRNA (guanine(966)-N(2))-methyltransferase RsmD [Phycisphaerales bacterium]|nr:16S rRNA (guanine(966)-N(2))-methyltransferase RsmD [Phycisphaerales bacterium]
MRIIAGEFRSRKLFTPPDAEITRPIPDRVKESVFMLLRGHIEGNAVFDGFAGTGAIGLEALSRGAKEVVFVEQNRQIAQILRKNIDHFGVGSRSAVVIGDTLGMGAIARCPSPVQVVFLDPPYPLVRDPLGWRRITGAMQQLAQNLSKDGFVVLRTPWPFFLDVPEEGPDPAELGPSGTRQGKWLKKRKKDEPHVKKGAWHEAMELESRRGVKKRGTPDVSGGSGGSGAARNTATPGGRPPKVSRGGKLNEAAFEAELDSSGGPFDAAWEELDLDEFGNVIETQTPEEIAAAAAKPAKQPVDLKIDGLKGPETHAYGTTAVHLYVRGS